MNLFDAEDDGAGRPAIAGVAAPVADGIVSQLSGQSMDAVAVGIRPEHLRLGTTGIEGEVTVVEELGSESFVHVRVTHRGEPTTIVVRDQGETHTARGDRVNVEFDGPVHVFGSDGERVDP